MATDEFQAQWRDRLASGSKLAARALAQALKETPGRLALIAPLAGDASPVVRVATMRTLEELSHTQPALVAQHAREVVEGLALPEADAQASALATLAQIAPHARAEVALALPLVADLLRARRPGLREEAARCLGRLGSEVPDAAPEVAARLNGALHQARHPRAAQEAREILAALEGVLPHLSGADRQLVGAAVAPMRGHPNLQVRERAGRLAKKLAA